MYQAWPVIIICCWSIASYIRFNDCDVVGREMHSVPVNGIRGWIHLHPALKLAASRMEQEWRNRSFS